MIDVKVSNNDFLIAIEAAQRQAEDAEMLLAEKEQLISELEAKILALEEKIQVDKQEVEEQQARLVDLAEQERLKLEDAFSEKIKKLELELEEKNSYIENLEKENRDRVPEPIPLTYKTASTPMTDDQFDELDLKDPVTYESTSRSYARPSLAHVVGERQKRKMSVRDLANAWSNRRFAA